MTALLAPPRTAVPAGKRVFDATTAAVLLVVLSPVLLILMATVVLTSPDRRRRDGQPSRQRETRPAAPGSKK